MPALLVRKRQDGRKELVGEVPDKLGFSSRWIARELGDSVRVSIFVQNGDEEVEYDLKGFELIDDDPEKPNFTGWTAERKNARESPRGEVNG